MNQIKAPWKHTPMTPASFKPTYTPLPQSSKAPYAQCTVSSSSTWTSPRAFAFNVKSPQSCSAERDKVANLRALIKSSEADLLEIDRYQERANFLNAGLLVSGLVMDTSIGFLDLAASMFSAINPAASKAAKGGIFAIQSTEKLGEAATGQRSYASAMGHITDGAVDTAVSVAEPKTLAGKAMLSTAKLHYDAAVVSIKAATGSSADEIKKDSFGMVKDRAKDNAGIMADALKEAGKDGASSTLKGLLVVGDMYEAAMRYQTSLESRFDTYLAQKQSDEAWVRNSKTNLRQMLTHLRTKLSQAVADLEACELGH